MAEKGDSEPGLREKTEELAKALKSMMDLDAAAAPSDLAADVFGRWLAEAGPASLKPELFADVAANYIVQDNSTKDLFDLFLMLSEYLEPEPEPDAATTGVFIGLPLIS